MEVEKISVSGVTVEVESTFVPFIKGVLDLASPFSFVELDAGRVVHLVEPALVVGKGNTVFST
ncbi:hypothetical protein SNOG_20175 [Parastagonospora nodorum SN15]|uniref:Uncharacterized protein n=1 Tax=Phaeosphaeria nodorum (strain SN15 / ATCC MYA-4574 / FGSC 10173) TaxID=321614 RepID=A9JXH1_PHANO|nr:hypothetical protein SNOG_20175 [Parastagonospora nodorum SN15]EDP89872.1 hypothetical protein SNOG_20175 [Parastagonospora nodorum SN15]